MGINDILHWFGAGSLLIYGLASAIMPRRVAAMLENGLSSGRGVSEFRVAHGGGMITLALFALINNNPLVYRALGWAWLGAAVIRVLSFLPDRPRLTGDYLAFLVIEVVLGIFLLL